MDFKKYYQANKTYLMYVDDRLGKIVRYCMEAQPTTLLDIGCGEGTLLNELSDKLPKTELYGTDVYSQNSKKWKYVVSDITKRIEFDDNSFDVVVLGEVIEHVPDPDFVLAEISRILKRDGRLIVSTPNVASWANRILVPLLGIQPLFTETSTKQNVGRRLKVLGQGEKVQGHLKVFTARSLKETIELNDFKVMSLSGSTFFFPSLLKYVDKAFSYVPSFASNLVVVARNVKA